MPDSSTERIGRYQLLEPIGGGPNGSVWRAKVFGVAGFERQFAIKRFHPELTTSPSTAQALSAAARSYGSLEHPRIARMSEFGVAQGQTFTAVELVAGLDAMRLVAESKLAGTGLAPGGSLALISQVARAVGYAHGRGLSHLGLAPSNVIVTVEGDVKVTDFGILASTMSAHPVDSPRLGARIGYIAPEQLVGEATSAATDVYVLGVIAYELVTGQRAFFGDTPQAVAQAILAGPPADPPLPRPIVRVLTRCLARSQFERFPDARAFADALDAALRVAPVPGTRKEIGAQVKTTLDRHAAMNDGNLSGMVALNMLATTPTPPPSPPPLPPPHHEEGLATNQFVRPDMPVPRPAPLVGPRSPAFADARSPASEPSPSATLPELPKPMTTTVPGVVPPIPVPQGVGGAQPSPPAIPPVGAQTMLGISPSKRPIPSVGSRIPAVMPIVPAAIPSIAGRPIPSTKGTIEIPKIAPASKPAEPAPPPQPLPLPSTTTATHPAMDERIAKLAELVPAGGGDEPETAPYAIIAEDDPLLDSLSLPIEEPARPLEPTETSPSIQVIRGSDPDLPQHRPGAHDLPTDQISPDLVRELKRASAESSYADDPLVELSLEALVPPDVQRRPTPTPPTPPRTRSEPMPLDRGDDGTSTVREGLSPLLPRRPPASPTRAAVGEPNRDGSAPTRVTPPRQAVPEAPLALAAFDTPALVDVARARDVSPARPRMPSPSPPSLVSPASEPARGIPMQPTAATILGITGPHPGAATSGLAAPGAPVQSTTPGFGPPAAPGFTLPSQARKRWPVIAAVAVVVVGGGGVVAWQLTKSDDVTTSSPRSGSATGSATIALGSARGSAIAVTGSATGSAMITTGSATGSAAIAVTGSTGSATPVGSAAIAVTGSAGSATPIGSAAIAMTGSAGSAAIAMTGSATPKPPGTPTSDALQITSMPPGARVFIDGADQGITPVKLAGTSDRHTMALLLAGHDLYVAEVDGHGSFSIPLTSITPSGGPAGIKVIKCKDKDRYYVSVDGKPTGMTCPTERIECTTGPHTVEVYDVVTETRRKWDITVTDTRLSYRVRIE